jgi:hypothetical protein
VSDSSIPAVIDYLLDLANRAVTQAGAPAVVVTDGWPDSLSHTMIGVGADRPPEQPSGQQSAGTAAVLTLGNMGIDENYGVDHYVYNGSGGVDQKACRDAVFAIFNPWVELLRADLLADTPPVPCLTIVPTNLTLSGPSSPEEAANGRFSLLSFTAMCRNIF